MKRPRIYADTSVFGGCFDDEFADGSRKFFEEIRAGKIILVVSRTTLLELNDAPEKVLRVLADLQEEHVEAWDDSLEIDELSQAYIDAGIISVGHRRDAMHIAAASVADTDVLVSWNFKHIVHFDKILGYQAINLLNGYRQIQILSPREVIEQ